MHQVHLELTDQLYDQAKRRAVEAEFETVGEYIADVGSDDLTEDTEELDHLLTLERIAYIDRVIDNVKAGGKTHTASEVRENFRKQLGG